MPPRPSRTLGLRVVAVAVVAAAAVLVAVRASSGNAQPATVSTDASSWRLPRLGGGGEVSLTQFRGRPLVVDFFASSCAACQGELPGLASVARQLQGKVTFVGVDSEEFGDGLAFARQYGIDVWPLAVDRGGAQGSGLHDAIGALGMPVMALYDAGGRLLRVVPGAISEADLRGLLSAAYGISL